jgi:signal transduction histidine kinase/DNA-binding response OmpR family regulator
MSAVQSSRHGGDAGLSRLSISARLVMLSSVLLVILLGVSLLLSRGLYNSAEALAEEARYVEVLRTASAAQKSFGDVKYWLTDLAVSLLNLSEERARQARTTFEAQLDALEPIDPSTIAAIRFDLDRVMARSLEAVDAYTEDRRVIGNSTMAQARVHVIAVDERLSQLVDRLGDEAARASAEARQDSAQAVRTSWIIIISASVFALVLTGLVLRSIVVPLGQITGAIRALTAGRTDVELPGAGRHEIGAIANTLALFRDGLIERNRLAAEREQAMQNLQVARDEATRSSRVLRVTFDHMAQGVAMFDAEHNLVAWNRQFGDLLGLPAEMLDAATTYTGLIRFLAERGDFGPGDPEDHLQERLSSLDQPYVGERTRAGGTVLEYRRNPVPGGGFVLMYSDITAQKRAQFELAELVSRLEEARDQADEANRTKSAFLANMSHELRTPLNAIIGYSEMLKEEAQDQGLDDFLPDLDRIESAGRHLLGVINDILDLSKIEAGKMDVYLEDFDIAALFEELQSIARPLVAKNNNRLEVVCPDDIGAMKSDLTKVKQCLLNLLGNSGKFTSDGKLTLEVSRSQGPSGPMVAFRVSDTGIGMSEQQVGKLFQAFSQADASTTKKFGGTGLGLAITRHFCTILGGDISVQSKPGEGSTFTITLPDRAGEAGICTPAAVPRVAEAPAGAATILVVDDDPAVLDLLSITLGKEGYRVIHARTGEEAIAQARAHRPQAITLDVIMPRMDGWSVLVALKADPDLRDIPVVVVSIVKDRGMALTLGAVDFMTKPVDRASLTAMLRHHCPVAGAGPVLLVEDDEAARERTRRVLDRLGFAAAEAGNGLEALRWLEANGPPSLILLDLMMPEMDGFAFLEAIQGHPAVDQVPVVVLTAKDLSREEKQMLSGRTAHVLAKGETSNLDLGEAIRRCIGPPPADVRPVATG